MTDTTENALRYYITINGRPNIIHGDFEAVSLDDAVKMARAIVTEYVKGHPNFNGHWPNSVMVFAKREQGSARVTEGEGL